MESNANNSNPSAPEEDSKSLENLKEDYQSWRDSASIWIKELLDIREKTDRETTIEQINNDIPFKGHTAWILICSIFVASIGLNANSTAVVIGAMLISPLMGPILGIGMGVAINDVVTLKRALINFAVMVVLSVVTAFVFFYIFPLKEDSSELLARTAPDVRDVLIAFFGGLALIIARTKEGTIASVIFGVAIATALMPPLCTAGYGLAIGNFSYFFGAMYLFVINTIFIALATYLILKLLRFPMVKYANQKKRKRTTRLISIVAILVMIPAIWTFYNVFQESLYYKQAKEFVGNEIEQFSLGEEARFVDELTQYRYDKRSKETAIELVFMGNTNIDSSIIKTWYNKLQQYPQLANTKLEILQGGKNEEVANHQYVVELYENIKSESKDKDEEIKLLKDEINRLKDESDHTLPVENIFINAHKVFEELDTIMYYKKVGSTKSDHVETVDYFTPVWNKDVDPDQRAILETTFSRWLENTYLKDRNNK